MVIGIAGEKAKLRSTGAVPAQYRIVDADTGTRVVIGPTSAGITQTGTNRYTATPQMPRIVGDYEIQWDNGSNAWPADWVEDLKVVNPGDVPLWYQRLLIA